jgi:heme exporter protein A
MLTVDNLSCRRGGRVVFRKAGFTVESGGFVLVRGSNGSGKSSMLRILAGLILPSEGRILWHNADIRETPEEHHARVHYIGHLDAVKPTLTVSEMCLYWAALRGINKKERCEYLGAFALSKLADHPVRSLSAGQKRRLSLTRLLICQTPLWLLDEPMTALDSEGQELLRTQMTVHRKNGGIIIAASHDEWSTPDMHIVDMGGGVR